MQEQRPLSILLAEDNDVDARAVMRALRDVRIIHPIVRVKDGVHALQVLRGAGPETLPRPYVVLLDLSMPRMDGLQFLEELRADPVLQSSVVFVLTTSNADEDRMRAYRSNVAGYVLKTRLSEGFQELRELIESYAAIVELP
ncbi:MAG: response regulator [Rhodocyclaceae bacterium]|nr:response regulator [Rhodocyclaceae bacterium]MBX3670069.1 response regulator [Rhodocyclaceae bacterium]